MSYTEIELAGNISYASNDADLGATIHRTSSLHAPSPNFVSEGGVAAIAGQRERNQAEMRSENSDFLRALSGAGSPSVDDTVKSHHAVISGRDKTSRRDDVICFRYLYDGHQHGGSALSEDKNETVPCLDSVPSAEFYAVSNATDLTVQRPGLDNEFCYSLAGAVASQTQGCQVLDSYFENMQSVDGGAGGDGGDDSGELFCGAKGRGNFEGFACSPREDKQRAFRKHDAYGRALEETSARNSIQTTEQPQSREFDDSADANEKENGDQAHSRDSSDSGRLANDSEILHLQPDFEQRSLCRKLGTCESTTIADLGQAKSMIISAQERSSEHSRISKSPESLELSRRNKALDEIRSLPKSSSLVGNFMSPHQRADLTRGISEIGNDMSLSEDAEADMDVIMEASDGLLQHSGLERKETSRNKKQMSGSTVAENGGRRSGKHLESSRNKAAQNSGEKISADVAAEQNGDDARSRQQVDGNAAVVKHIYPWMKESRQNTRRKQITSSNTSSSGDKSSKRERTAYTNSQLVELEKEFHFNRYLCRPRRIEMAQMLNLTERQIKIWFQNRRMKYKKDQKLKTMPMAAMERDGSFYHQHHHHHHHHSPNAHPDLLFSRNNDHRHYFHAGHAHSGDADLSVPAAHGGMNCTTGGRCYHGHRQQHGRHLGQEPVGMAHQALVRSSSDSFDGISKTYPSVNHRASSSGRLTSPSSSSNGTLSPGSGRTSGGFAPDAGMRAAPCGGETQGQPVQQQTGCSGFLSPHTASPSGMDGGSPDLRERSASDVEARRLLNHSGYDLSFTGHGLPAFHGQVDSVPGRMAFGSGGQALTPPSLHQYSGCYGRQKGTASIAMLAEASAARGGASRFGSVHNPLESLTDCVHHSPRDFSQQSSLQFGHSINGGRRPSADGFPTPFISSNGEFDRNMRFERAMTHYPVDYSRSKSSSPRTQPSDVYLSNRLTHL